jgi:hypothetical protein
MKLSLSLLLLSFLSNIHQRMITVQETIYKITHFPTIILSRKSDKPFTKLMYIILFTMIKTQVIVTITWFLILISRASFIFSLFVLDVIIIITKISNNIIQKPIFPAIELKAFQAVFFWFSSIIHGIKSDIIATMLHITVIFDEKLKYKLLNRKSW